MLPSPSANFADVTEKQRSKKDRHALPVNLGLVKDGGRGSRMPFTEPPATAIPRSSGVPEKPFWLAYENRPVHFGIADEVDGRISC